MASTAGTVHTFLAAFAGEASREHIAVLGFLVLGFGRVYLATNRRLAMQGRTLRQSVLSWGPISKRHHTKVRCSTLMYCIIHWTVRL